MNQTRTVDQCGSRTVDEDVGNRNDKSVIVGNQIGKPHPDSALSAESLERARESGQSRSAVVLKLAYLQGVENGRRMAKRDIERQIEGMLEQSGENESLGRLLKLVRNDLF